MTTDNGIQGDRYYWKNIPCSANFVPCKFPVIWEIIRGFIDPDSSSRKYAVPGLTRDLA
jgi:hypothetical protein